MNTLPLSEIRSLCMGKLNMVDIIEGNFFQMDSVT